MADANTFKQYGRRKREATLLTEFTAGMMFSDSPLQAGFSKTLVNYDFSKNNNALMPRAGLRTIDVLMPDMVNESESDFHSDDDIMLKASRDCVESDGKTYRQLIFGDKSSHKIWVSTINVENILGEGSTDKLAKDVIYSIKAELMETEDEPSDCSFFEPDNAEIHGVKLSDNVFVSSLVGSFAYGNSFYFIDGYSNKLMKTVFNANTEMYEFDEVDVIDRDPGEAVTYGYNMLAGSNAYVFKNSTTDSSVINLQGIMPYTADGTDKLLMTPKQNELVKFRLYLNGNPLAQHHTYKFIWQWRTMDSDEWIDIVPFNDAVAYELVTTTGSGIVQFNDGTNTIPYMEITFTPPSKDIMVRVQAINTNDEDPTTDFGYTTVEHAITVGFDFSADSYGLNSNMEQNVYNLFTSTGVAFWKNRLVLYGCKDDPTILWISDVNEPGYFPYPNNIGIFDEPIIFVKEFMETLLVFTTDKLYQLKLDEEGNGWTTTLIQSNLLINPWDRHLIQTVRNMVFFKSGNYYYMVVPKASSTTGELTLAPISNSITEFFNFFSKNVESLMYDVFDYTVDPDNFNLVHYYNFLDYEDMHNMYVYEYTEDDVTNYFHFDLVYNTVARSWRICTFDSPGIIFSYKQDATQSGILATTSRNPYILADPDILSNGTVVTGLDTALVIESEDLYFPYLANGFIEDYDDGLVAPYYLNGIERHAEVYYGISNNIVCTDSNIGNSFSVELSTSGATYGYESTNMPINSSVSFFNQTVTEPHLCAFSYETEYDLDDYTKLLFNGVELPSTAYDVEETDTGYMFLFYVNFTTVPIISLYPEYSGILGRTVQLLKFNNLLVDDYHVPNNIEMPISSDSTIISDTINSMLDSNDAGLNFHNWQFLDTGYLDDAVSYYKRYRELQLVLHNVEGRRMEFGMDFILNGEKRITYYKYETEQVLDETDPNYGLVYVIPTPVMNLPVPLEPKPHNTMLGESFNNWVLDESVFPEVNLWKMRAPISGKGMAPRLRLLSRNTFRYKLQGVNWLYRIMNMR